jgi:predicted dehydrogenase
VLQDFIRALQQGVPPAITGRSALTMQQVIDATMQGSKTGQAVQLPTDHRA